MIVLVLTAVPPGLRGDLSRWLIEVAPGVFTGRVSRRVRDRLWDRVQAGVRGGSAVLVAASRDTEQGYEILTCGRDRWVPADFDGLTLMRKPRRGATPDGPRTRKRRPGGRRAGQTGRRRLWTLAVSRLRPGRAH